MVEKKRAKSFPGIYIAAIGASAGGLDALQKLISHIPSNIKNVAFIVVQHLSPTYKSMLVQTLSNQTELNVVEVGNKMKINAGQIYITPPDCEVSISNGILFLHKTQHTNTPHPSIDSLFSSLADDVRHMAIGIILSGTGTDGAIGIRAIKEKGGVTLVQNPTSAKYNGMPTAAIATGAADFVLAPDKIAGQIADIAANLKHKPAQFSKTQSKHQAYQEIIALLARETGTNFTNYKQNTLHRRINKRMAELNIESAAKYLAYIEKHQPEVETLFSNVLIGVTNFFRDANVFKALEKQMSVLIDRKDDNSPVRVWMPGCSTGEETYTVAMIIADILKKKKRVLPVQIFGTDIDEQALATARKAVYPNKALQPLPAEKAKEYFIKHNGYVEVSKAIRSMVLFSKHDLTHNPPFLKLDLIVCRNLLIYFNNRLQDYIFPVFFSALNPHGYLLLGKSESIGHFTDLFTTVSSEARIYQRKGGVPLHNIRYTPLKPAEAFKSKTLPYDFSITDMVKETLYKIFEHPYVVVNDNADIKEISGDVSPYLGLKHGSMNANLYKLAHDDLRIELRSLINKCVKENREARGNIRKLVTGGKKRGVKITVRPLLYAQSPNEYYLVVFEEVKYEAGPKAKPAAKRSDSNHNLVKELELELDATKADLQNFVERLENANTELQTINEEAQSTNEELRISNEELETTNEELQSSNEEINIAYAELKAANIELEKQEILLRKSEVNMLALLKNTLQSFVLIDQDYKVIACNEHAVKTFKTLSGLKLVAGDNFEKLISRKEFAAFVLDFKHALKGKSVITERTLTTKAGAIKTYISSFTPIADGHKALTISFSILDITELAKTRADLLAHHSLLTSVFHTADIGISILNPAGRIIKINEGLCKLLGYQRTELEGKSWYILSATESDRKIAKATNEEILAGGYIGTERVIKHKDGSTSPVYATSNLLQNADGSRYIIKTIRDISETNKYKSLLQLAEQLAKLGGFEIDGETHKINWTDELYNLFEVKKDFVPDIKWIYTLYDEKDRPEAIKRLEDALKRGKGFEVTRQVTIAGKIKWIHIIGKPEILISKKYRLIGTIQDITAQKLAEDEIVRLSYVASHTNNPVIITSPQGEVEWVNNSFESLTGYSLKELKGKVPGHILQGAGTDKAAVKRISDRLLQKKASTGEILLNYTKAGKPVWISTDITPIFKNGDLINFVGIMTDLTEVLHTRDVQKKQDVLLHKQELFNAISRHFPNGIIGIIDQHLKYVFVGGTELKKLGLNHHDLIGDNIFDKISPESNAFAEPFLKRAFDNEKVSFEINVLGNTYLVIAVPVKDKDQPITQVVVVISNITQQKATEEELHNAIEQQKELNDLKSKFVSIASHEFRTPLSTILSSSFLLEKYNNQQDESKREKHLKRIKKSVNSLTDILNDFLTLGKIEETGIKNRPAPFNIRHLFKELLDEMQGILKDGQHIKFHKKGADDMVNLDRQHFTNVMRNLISNAIKYSPEGKPIIISAGYRGNLLEIKVTDEGIGIPEEDQKRIFNTFYRAHNVTNIPGTGMGLHIVKKYLDTMDGTIEFTSQLNKGSTFIIKLKQAEIIKSAGQ